MPSHPFRPVGVARFSAICNSDRPSFLYGLIVTLLWACLSLPVTAADNVGSVKGRAIDASSGAAVDYADVFVSDMNDRVLASGIVVDGLFRVDNVPVGDVLVMVRMLGYDTWISERLSLRSGEVRDLGTVRLSQLALGLQEVTVSGDRNQIVYKLDRRHIDGASSVTAAGGTAVDILASAPSVHVDADGSLTLRGSSNFLVYVDGKPSPLSGTDALRQIPAGTIDDIEIITTPSARYRTDGDMGIINITTRRSRSEGWSGLLNVSGSTLGTYSLDGILSRQLGRHSLYVGGTEQKIQGLSEFNQEKTTIVDDVYTRSVSEGTRLNELGTHTLRGGWQYADGRRHNLSLDLLFGRTSNWRGGDLTYDEMSGLIGSSYAANRRVYTSHDRYNLRKDLFQTSLDYNLQLSPKDQLAATSRFRYDSYSREYTESNMFDTQGVRFEGTRGYEEEHHWDCDGSLAWTHSLTSGGHYEMGYQYTTYSEHGGYRICYWDRTLPTPDFVWQDQLATPFYYRRQVHSGYAMIDDQRGDFTYDAGLRADHVIDFTDIGIAGTSRFRTYTNLFPSGHLAWEAGRAGTFTVGASRRTNRPGIWNLEPYITYEDYYTKKIGNPDIRPEFITSGEAGWRRAWDGGHSLSFTGICRYRTDITDWVRRPYEPGVTLDSIVNAGNQWETGLEMSGVVHPVSWWTSTLNGSLFAVDFESTCPVCTDRRGTFSLLTWINAFTLPADTRLQLDAHYVGPRVLTQGSEDAYWYADLAARRPFFGQRLTLSLVARDVFHTACYRNIRQCDGLTSITVVRPVWPNIVLSAVWNFNASRHKSTDTPTTGNLFEGKEF